MIAFALVLGAFAVPDPNLAGVVAPVLTNLSQ